MTTKQAIMKRTLLLPVVLAMLCCAKPGEVSAQSTHTRFDSLYVEVLKLKGAETDEDLIDFALYKIKEGMKTDGSALSEAAAKEKAERLVRVYMQEQYYWDNIVPISTLRLRRKISEKDLEEYLEAFREAQPTLEKMTSCLQSEAFMGAVNKHLEKIVAAVSAYPPKATPKVSTTPCSESYKATFNELYETVLKDKFAKPILGIFRKKYSQPNPLQRQQVTTRRDSSNMRFGFARSIQIISLPDTQ